MKRPPIIHSQTPTSINTLISPLPTLSFQKCHRAISLLLDRLNLNFPSAHVNKVDGRVDWLKLYSVRIYTVVVEQRRNVGEVPSVWRSYSVSTFSGLGAMWWRRRFARD